jgi:hypothetical protein
MSLQNCGGCGMACSTSNIAAVCTAGHCEGTCASGFLDCNDDKRRDGCECAGDACCTGGTCETVHDNGVGQSFYDCQPKGTYDVTEATAACAAWAVAKGGSRSNCASYSGGGDSIVCSDAAGSTVPCNCWGYSGAVKGRVDNSGNSSCNYPLGSSWPMWN